MGDIIPIGGITKLDLPVDAILEGAKGKMDSVILIGIDKEGEPYFASTYADGGEVMWWLEKCKQALMNVAVDGD